MSNIVYRQMPAPRELPQQTPSPRAKARMQKPQGGGKFLVQIPGVRGGMVMDEIDTCITHKHGTFVYTNVHDKVCQRYTQFNDIVQNDVF